MGQTADLTARVFVTPKRGILDPQGKTVQQSLHALGFSEVGREGQLVRYKAGDTAIGGIVDIHEAGGFLPGRMGGGSVHHIAFRAADDAEERAMARKLVENHGLHPTEQRDRNYFRSIYFREPGGVLFEIATDPPGFAIDEASAELGTHLMLPPWLEPRRNDIEPRLPPISVPGALLSAA